MEKQMKNIGIVLLSLALIFSIFILTGKDDSIVNYEEDLNIYFLDVGQGDSTIITMPDGRTALIDGGSKNQSDKILSKLKELNISKIDYLIATHPHEDHIGGLPEIIRNTPIGEIYMPRKSNTTKIFEELLLTIKDKDIKVIEAKSGVEIFKNEDLVFKILGPDKEYSDINNNSVVTELSYGDTNFIMTGDLEEKGEKSLLDKNLIKPANVLKIGHHGSNTSTSSEFLNKINPDYGIISCGENNSYDHPDEEILNLLKDCQVEILRTDKIGDIKLISDGKRIIKGD